MLRPWYVGRTYSFVGRWLSKESLDQQPSLTLCIVCAKILTSVGL